MSAATTNQDTYVTNGAFRIVVATDRSSNINADGSYTEVSGLLQYNHNGVWGTVCDDQFDRNNTQA